MTKSFLLWQPIHGELFQSTPKNYLATRNNNSNSMHSMGHRGLFQPVHKGADGRGGSCGCWYCVPASALQVQINQLPRQNDEMIVAGVLFGCELNLNSISVSGLPLLRPLYALSQSLCCSMFSPLFSLLVVDITPLSNFFVVVLGEIAGHGYHTNSK